MSGRGRDSIDLRTFSYIDVLQPGLAGFIATVATGFQPLERQAALFVEVAPGMSINIVTDVVLKHTSVIPGMQIVERAYGLLEVHSFDQGQVKAAGAAILDHLGTDESARLKPRVVSRQIITGLEGYHTMLINRMRHGDMINENETMYLLEVHPAGYAAIATNEAEKAANIKVLEMISFGAFGRIWLGGKEEDINQADKAVMQVLQSLGGRENPGKSLVY